MYFRDNDRQMFLFCDLETENLSLLSHNRPWNCSWILYKNGKILEQHDKFVWWEDLNISKDAARITRFDYNEYKEKAEDADKVLNEFEKYLNNKEYVPVFHNGTNFDCYIIKIWREALGRKNDYSYLDRTIDTNSIARAIKKGVKQIKPKERKMMMFRFANYVEKGLKTNLTALGKEFGIKYDYENLHNSVADVILTGMVFDKLKYMIEI